MSKRHAKRPRRAQRKPAAEQKKIPRRKWRLTPGMLLAGIVLIAIVACISLEIRAESKSKSFCRKFPPGSFMADVAHMGRNEGDAKYRSIDEKEITIAYTGIFPNSPHICRINGESGRVNRVRYIHSN